MSKPGSMRLLFSVLRDAGYEWQPQTPDRLLTFRKDPSAFRPLVKLLGLGLPVSKDELIGDGLGDVVIKTVLADEFIRDASGDAGASTNPSPTYKSTMAVSGAGDVHIVHDHWPPDQERSGGYVHYAAESAWFARALNRDLEGFIGKRVLDLGCSSGALCFEVAGVADVVLGLDVSERSISWARTNAAALGFKNIRFEMAAIGEPAAETAATGHAFDIVIMNPPMVVPSKDAAYVHRDGGKLGVELPLLFLDFSWRHLREGGEVLMLATNPIVNGIGVFFDRLDRQRWDFVEKRCVHSHFNQAVARKQGYAEQGIERIELWFLHLKKNA
ncbi:MAG: class I SAM-dependent methyltransferase [Deltaproteobacteria bacterium]|nr:class I SAM-dependent methyltransferase [Deltaproteobacteria bacterium]